MFTKLAPPTHIWDNLKIVSCSQVHPNHKTGETNNHTIKIWTKGANTALQDHFHNTDWSWFALQATTNHSVYIDSYTNSVLEYINSYGEMVTVHKTIKNISIPEISSALTLIFVICFSTSSLTDPILLS